MKMTGSVGYAPAHQFGGGKLNYTSIYQDPLPEDYPEPSLATALEEFLEKEEDKVSIPIVNLPQSTHSSGFNSTVTTSASNGDPSTDALITVSATSTSTTAATTVTSTSISTCTTTAAAATAAEEEEAKEANAPVESACEQVSDFTEEIEATASAVASITVCEKEAQSDGKSEADEASPASDTATVTVTPNVKNEKDGASEKDTQSDECKEKDQVKPVQD